MVEPTDEELMTHFTQGNEQAFDTLFARRAPQLHSFLGGLVREPALAEDLLQTTFLSMVRSRDRWRPGSKVAPWLFSIAANAARDALRHRSRWQGDEDALAALPSPVSAEAKDPALARRLETALSHLPLQQREAVVLHHVLDWSFEEMAAALGANATTMRVRAHRGFAKLRELLDDLRPAKEG